MKIINNLKVIRTQRKIAQKQLAMDTGYGPPHAKLSVLFFIISQTASAPAFSFRSHSLCSVACLSRQEKQAQIKCPPCCDQDGRL